MALFEVIKKNKTDDNLTWRYPKRNFNTLSQLVVQESQEAIFFANGKALDLFGPGKYTLHTNNIPLLRDVIGLATGFKTPFTCDVYFIDKTSRTTKWGTSSKIEFLEPKYKFPIQIGACGEMRFKVEDSRKLLVKLVGAKASIENTTIDSFFQSHILTNVKAGIAKIINDEGICIFEIDQKLDELSNKLTAILSEDLKDYGIELEKFFVTTILKPEDDKQYLEFKELFFKKTVGVEQAELAQKLTLIEEETKAKQKVMASEAEATKRRQEGYTYQEERSFDVSEKVADNQAVGQFSNVGVGLGVMSGMGTSLGGAVSNKVTGAMAVIDGTTCPSCGTKNETGVNFCKKCGTNLQGEKRCPDCGNKVEVDAIFCNKCGKKLGE